MTTPIVAEEHASEAYRVSASGITHVRAFTVLAYSPPDALSVLAAQTGVARGAIYREAATGAVPDPNLECQELTVFARTPATVGNKGLFQVEARYDVPNSPTPEPDGPAVWSVETSTTNAPVDIDIHGNPIVNAAGEPIDPPLTAPRVNEIIAARWIRTGTDIFDAIRLSRQYRSRVNSAAWKGGDPREILCHSLQPDELQPGTIRYVARFEWKNSYLAGSATVAGWDAAVVERGWRYVGTPATKTVDGRTVPNYINTADNTGKDSAKPMLLDSDGKLLADGADPVFTSWELIPEADFNTLGI